MANYAFTNALVTVNGVDLSDQVAAVSLEVSGDSLDNTAMGDTYRSRIGGLLDTSWTITFHNDHAASEVETTLWSAINTVVTCTLKPVNAATSATNPLFRQSVHISGFAPVGGSVGDLAQVSVTWPGAGTLTRATS
jgi:hypothetical protein